MESNTEDIDDYYCCDHDWTEPEEVEKDYWRRECKVCGAEQMEYLTVAYWRDKYMVLNGTKYRALKSWGNISKCSHCDKVIMGVPLILWNAEDPRMAVTFHDQCAFEAGIFDHIASQINTTEVK